MWCSGSDGLAQQLPAQACPFIHPATAASKEPFSGGDRPQPGLGSHTRCTRQKAGQNPVLLAGTLMPVVPLFSGTVSLGPGPQPGLLIPILQSIQGPGLPTPPRLASLHLLPEGFPKCRATPTLEPPELSSRVKPLCPSLTCSTGLPSLGRLTPQVPHHQAPSLLSSPHQLHSTPGTDEVGGSIPTQGGNQDQL